jgi:hypothetical protein
MVVLFGVDLNNPEDNEAVASMPKAVPFVVDLLLFEDNGAVALSANTVAALKCEGWEPS